MPNTIEVPTAPAAAGSKAETSSTAASGVNTAVLFVTVLLCLIACILMLILDPRSLAVDSVYQAF